MSRENARGWFSGLCGVCLALGTSASAPVLANDANCAQVSPEALRALGDVIDAQFLYRFQQRPYVRLPEGVRLMVPAPRGVTAADLHRAATCLAAQDARSPMSVPGAKVRVARSGSAYVVYVTAQDRKAAREIQRRAAQL